MKHVLLPVLLALACAAAPAIAATAAAAPLAARLSPDIFFENPQFDGALLSPDGKHLAFKISGKNKRIGLGVVNLGDMSVKPLALFNDTDVRRVQWVNKERLVFDTQDRETAQGMIEFGPGLYTVKTDGSPVKQLVDRINGGVRAMKGRAEVPLLPWHTFLPAGTGTQDSDEIYVENVSFNRSDNTRSVSLLRLNTVSGRHRTFTGPKATTQRFLFDHKGEPRLALAADDGQRTVHLRDPETGEWRELARDTAYQLTDGNYEPQGFGPDGTLYVRAYHGDKMALFTLDLGTGKLAEKPVVTMADFDFSGGIVVSNGKLLGFHYLGDARGTVWQDKRMQEIQAEVDARLSTTVNQISIGRHHASPWLLVRAYADNTPTIYLMYNPETKTFNKVGDTRPRVKAADMARQNMVKVKTRDGLEIPVWVTTPQGPAKNLPMVVLVHGGPYVRGSEWGWDPDAQFLASRGYLVVEPEFRGSAGYGRKLLTAGFKQWGLKMQDDIADAARWAIALGMADPGRVCIAGASYGGYATLMGLVKDADLYKCGINWVGVTDIELMYTGSWLSSDDLPAAWKKHGMPHLIGDRVKDAQQLRETSPLHQAAKIRQPLLMAYGGADQRVPLYHGKKFLDAVRAGGNQQVEWIEYSTEGHGWFLPENRIDFWTRVEKFLDRHIGSSGQ